MARTAPPRSGVWFDAISVLGRMSADAVVKKLSELGESVALAAFEDPVKPQTFWTSDLFRRPYMNTALQSVTLRWSPATARHDPQRWRDRA